MKSDLENPDWERIEDWPFEEDWGSPAWEKRIAELNVRISQRREKYGFVGCPKCKTVHTGKTLMCRECEYRVHTPKRQLPR